MTAKTPASRVGHTFCTPVRCILSDVTPADLPLLGDGVTEHEIETPCGWCGATIAQPLTARKRRYCKRACRQHAYELRAAQRRRQADIETGRIWSVPAQQVVERVDRQVRHGKPKQER
ncbi:hypothetical protein GCM10027186_57550 [Micromonospora schwarzwaldensis]